LLPVVGCAVAVAWLVQCNRSTTPLCSRYWPTLARNNTSDRQRTGNTMVSASKVCVAVVCVVAVLVDVVVAG
jgi:hypothetical protein